MRFPVDGNRNSCSCLAPAIRPGKSLLLTTGTEHNSSIFSMVAELRFMMWGCPCICFLRTCLFLQSNMQTACFWYATAQSWYEWKLELQECHDGENWVYCDSSPSLHSWDWEKCVVQAMYRATESFFAMHLLPHVKSRRKGGEMATPQFRIKVLCWCRWELLNPRLL